MLGTRGDYFIQRVIGKRPVVGGSAHVLERELHRVHTQLIGNFIHHRFDAPETMGLRGGTKVARGGAIGVDRVNRTQTVGTSINIHATNAARVFPVRAHATIAAHLHGRHRAIVHSTNFVVLNGGPAAMYTQPVVTA